MRPDQIPGVSRGMAGVVRSQAASVTPAVTLYNIGDRVQHRKFGPGTVVGTSGAGTGARVKIEFDRRPHERICFLRCAHNKAGVMVCLSVCRN